VQAQVQDQEHQEQVKGKVSHFKIPSTDQQINKSTLPQFRILTFK
jgi:hypothetical protein